VTINLLTRKVTNITGY